MKINIKEVLKITEKYGSEEVPVVYLTEINAKNDLNILSIVRGTRFDSSQYESLEKLNINEIDVVYNEKLYAKLTTNFPTKYRLPVGRKNVIELDRIIDDLEATNGNNKKKRCVVSLTEIYRRDEKDNLEIVLKYGEKLTYQRWNEIKTNMSRNTLIDFRYNEGGIVVFYLLHASDPYYPQKFINFTEIVSMIVDSRKFGVYFSPDFVPETDVYTVNNKNELLKTYANTNSSLIVIGGELEEECREALSQIKAYDRYAKMIVIKNPDPSRRIEILNQIKYVYGLKLWEGK